MATHFLHRSLPEEVAKDPSITEIRARSERLTEVPPLLLGMHWLEKLELGGNYIEHVPDLSSMTSLRVLGLGHTRLSEIPEGVLRAPNLKVLDLGYTRITDFAPLHALRNLRGLDIGGTPAEALPPSLEGLPLTKLAFDTREPIDTALFDTFTDLVDLEITMRWVELDRLPETVYRPALEKLKLETWNARLGSLAGLRQATKLRRLELDLDGVEPWGCGPARYPELIEFRYDGPIDDRWDLGGFTALRELHVRGGWGSGELPSFEAFPDLEELWVHGVPFSRWPAGMAALGKLSKMDIEGAKVLEIPDWIGDLLSLEKIEICGAWGAFAPLYRISDRVGELPNLETLNLRRTRLAELPASLANAPKLRRVFVGGTRLAAVPSELVAKLDTLDAKGCVFPKHSFEQLEAALEGRSLHGMPEQGPPDPSFLDLPDEPELPPLPPLGDDGPDRIPDAEPSAELAEYARLVQEANVMIQARRTFVGASGRWSIGSAKAALALLRQARAILPHRHESWHSEGVVHTIEGKSKAAVKAYEETVARAPELRSAYYDLAFELGLTRSVKKAAAAWSAFLERWPRDAKAHANYGHVLRRRKDFQGALLAFGHSLALDPSLVAVRAVRAEVMVSLGMYTTARSEAESILEVHPGHEASVAVLGMLGRILSNR